LKVNLRKTDGVNCQDDEARAIRQPFYQFLPGKRKTAASTPVDRA
jgi:hypothetical protein